MGRGRFWRVGAAWAGRAGHWFQGLDAAVGPRVLPTLDMLLKRSYVGDWLFECGERSDDVFVDCRPDDLGL